MTIFLYSLDDVCGLPTYLPTADESLLEAYLLLSVVSD